MITSTPPVVARTVATDAPVLVLDDPTSALDTVTESRVAQRLSAARAGRTTILISTSPTLLAACDRVVLVDAGQAVATGTHHDVLRTQNRYRHLVGADQKETP